MTRKTEKGDGDWKSSVLTKPSISMIKRISKRPKLLIPNVAAADRRAPLLHILAGSDILQLSNNELDCAFLQPGSSRLPVLPGLRCQSGTTWIHAILVATFRVDTSVQEQLCRFRRFFPGFGCNLISRLITSKILHACQASSTFSPLLMDTLPIMHYMDATASTS